MTVRRNGNLMFLALAFVFSVLAGGCSNVPVAEIKVFRESVTTANSAATPVLDELSLTERNLKRGVVARRKEVAFVVGEAAYISDIGDAPATALLRRGHNTLDRFSDVLLGLATGAGVQNDVAEIESLATETNKLLGAFSAFLPQAAVAGAALQEVATVSEPGLKLVFDELSRREAKKLIERAVQQNVVKQLTDDMIATTPYMFQTLIRQSQRASRNMRLSDDVRAEAGKTFADRKEKVRLVLSNYVVLLQRVNSAWDEAVKATQTQSSISTIVLTQRVTELRIAAEETRKAYLQLHTDE